MAEKIEKGLFITFEGPEGSGKSTQASLAADSLRSRGYKVLHTSEPGGTALGKKVREIILEKDEIPMGSLAELFLFEADRAQHVREVIRPAIRDKKIVICDRFNTATFAYQGYGLGMDMDLINRVDDAATGALKPDLTVLLDIDIKLGMSRAHARSSADRMEKRGEDFHRKVREGYLDLASRDAERIKVIEVAEDIDRTREKVEKEIYGLIERHKRAG
jgi:dTMP kinase